MKSVVRITDSQSLFQLFTVCIKQQNFQSFGGSIDLSTLNQSIK